MANRHLSRSVVMQTLFEWDFNGAAPAPSEESVDSIIKRNAAEFAPGMEDISFIRTLIYRILKKREVLDSILSKAAPDWPIEKISIVDRNILRIGLYELLFVDKEEVPAKVAINEAIELAKTFGGENSGKFINGVLGAVYKEMGEPGKNDAPRKRKPASVDLSRLPVEKLCGAVVYAREVSDVYLALVHDIFGRWTLTKGHLEAGDKDEDGVVREVREELGIAITVREKLGENEYVASDPERGKIRKHVTYFLAEAPFTELNLKKSGGLDDARWFRLADIIDLNTYDDILPIITKAINILLKK